MLHDILSRHLGIPEHRVRVINKDVGGSFGLKIHTYPDEIATCAARGDARPAGEVPRRPHRVVPDRHPLARPSGRRGGGRRPRRDDPRRCASTTSPRSGPSRCTRGRACVESGQVLRSAPGPTGSGTTRPAGAWCSRTRPPMSQYRAVGHPVAVAGHGGDGRPGGAASSASIRSTCGAATASPRHVPVHRAHRALLREASRTRSPSTRCCGGRIYPTLCARAGPPGASAVYRGSASACSSISRCRAPTYGTGGARISSQDGTTIRLEPSGKLPVAASVTEQGQGTDTILAQVAAETVGVPIQDVRVVTGDTLVTPYGGGTWGSRGAGHRRRGHAPDRQGAQGEHPEGGGCRSSRWTRSPSTCGDGQWSTRPPGSGACRSPSSVRVGYFRPDTCRRTSSPS